jgi:hypothetical protein
MRRSHVMELESLIAGPGHFADSELVRISADVIFHRDALRPVTLVPNGRHPDPGGKQDAWASGKPQLSLDFDDS